MSSFFSTSTRAPASAVSAGTDRDLDGHVQRLAQVPGDELGDPAEGPGAAIRIGRPFGQPPFSNSRRASSGSCGYGEAPCGKPEHHGGVMAGIGLA